MGYVPVPKDLTKVKTKVALNLTKRQIICFGLGGAAGIPAYLLTRGAIGNEAAALLMIGLMLPFFAFGIYEKDGQPLERALWNFISVSFLRPPARPYRTDNGYAALMRQADLDKEAEKFGSRLPNFELMCAEAHRGYRIEKKTAGGAGKKPAGRTKTARGR